MSNYLRTDRLWLIGAGPMAVDYANVLRALEVPFEVIGRGLSSAESFRQKTGLSVHQGGLRSALEKAGKAPDQAIIAVSVEQLGESTIELLRKGTRRILLEKPGGMSSRWRGSNSPTPGGAVHRKPCGCTAGDRHT